MNIRRKLKLCFIILASAFMTIPAAAEKAEPTTHDLFIVERVSASVYALLAKPTAVFNGNGMVIVMQDHLIVVDAHSSPLAAASALRQIRRDVSSLPVRFLVLTHGHLDHAHGALAYVQEGLSPSQIIASLPTRTALGRAKQDIQGFASFLQERRGALQAGLVGLDGPQANVSREAVNDINAYLGISATTEVPLPGLIVDNSLRLQDGKLAVDVKFLGRGHSAGDLVVHVPSEGVIFAGDMAHGFEPLIHASESFPDEWIGTLESLEALSFHVWIGGHTGVHRDRRLLSLWRQYLGELVGKVAECQATGKTAEQTKAALGVEAFQSLSAEGLAISIQNQYDAWLFDFYRPRLRDAIAKNVLETYEYIKERAKEKGISHSAKQPSRWPTAKRQPKAMGSHC